MDNITVTELAVRYHELMKQIEATQNALDDFDFDMLGEVEDEDEDVA